jgi:hypothetical protein
VVVPRFLDLLQRRGLKLTVFIVGQDAAQPRNGDVLRSIVQSGHEVGNHSFYHEPWLHLYSEEQVENEITSAEQAIEQAFGVRPIGFRGPGYSLSENVLRTLIRRGYEFDGSTLPTFIGPLARTYYFMTAKNLSAEDRAARKKLFGTLRDGLRPLRPYSLVVDEGRILEIPVTTMPGLRLPIHISYMLYIAMYSKTAALAYFRSAMRLCRMAGIEPSLLLHPLDFIGRGEAPPLDFFPAMQMPASAKAELLDRVFDILTDQFDVVPMGEHARRIGADERARSMDLRWQPS